MRKFLRSVICTILALFIYIGQTLAFQPQTNHIEDEIYGAFIEVENLLATIENNNDVTYDFLALNNSELVENVSSSAAIALNATASNTPPFVSAFLWGCIFNVPGMLIVGITTGFDNSQMKKSAWGCLVNTLLFGSSSPFWLFGN
jgi:hypothetical protein